MRLRLLFVVLVLAILLGFGNSIYANTKTFYVPKDFATIQEAINAASDGDVIAVSGGTYKDNIYFKGKSLTLTSTNPDNPSATIIEGTEAGSVITIDSNSVIKGFTITSKNVDCRGIYVKDASPTIENCTIIDNQTTGSGGGIYSTNNSSPKIVNCIIIENTDSRGTSKPSQVYGGTSEIRTSWVGDELADGSAGGGASAISEETADQTIAASRENATIEEPEIGLTNAPYKEGELLVRFAPKAKGKMRSKIEKTAVLDSISLEGGTIEHEFKIVPGLSVVKLPPGVSVEKALEKFNKAKEKGEILYAEPNYIVKALSIPNDTRFNELWGMNNTGQTGGTSDADIDAPEAWDIVTNANPIIVAVIDGGVDYTHPDLASNMWVNPGEIPGDGIDNDGNGYIDDVHGINAILPWHALCRNNRCCRK
jgi:parallel beta-helix repeat protein